MRYRLMASYLGASYQAAVGPSDRDVTLFAAPPPPEEHGFSPAPGGIWRKQVRLDDLDGLWESRPIGSYHGEPCLVLDDLGDRLHIVYLGMDERRAAARRHRPGRRAARIPGRAAAFRPARVAEGARRWRLDRGRAQRAPRRPERRGRQAGGRGTRTRRRRGRRPGRSGHRPRHGRPRHGRAGPGRDAWLEWPGRPPGTRPWPV